MLYLTVRANIKGITNHTGILALISSELQIQQTNCGVSVFLAI
jgi:hypothetical protein